jgi:hypothetical protein
MNSAQETLQETLQETSSYIDERWLHIEQCVHSMSTQQLRKTLRHVDTCATKVPNIERCVDMLLPDVGVTVGEFCLAYVTRPVRKAKPNTRITLLAE